MSAFQDFGYLSERRRAERAARRKRLILIAAAVFTILVITACAAAAVYHNNNGSSYSDNHHSTTNAGSKGGSLHSSSSSSSSSASSKSDSDSNSNSTPTTPKNEPHSSATIQALCTTTDYRESCESSLKNYVKTDSTPKELVRASVDVIVDEVGKAFNKSDAIESTDPDVKGAVESCREMHGYAMDQLATTLRTIQESDLTQLSKQVHDLKTWLSAVIAYQQACIDGFPEGEVKSKMQEAMSSAKEFTSNALAIMGSIKSLLSLVHLGGKSRRLLVAEPAEPAEPALGKDGLPSWIGESARRFLGKATKEFTPNVTVAKDGNGDFTTISAALAKLPEKYDGRYVIYLKEGVYEEQVVISRKMVNITLYGDGSRKTIITGSKNFVDGIKTFDTATFAAIGDGFIAVSIGFQNTAGAAKHQAVALRVQSDRAIFLNCRMEAYQDTLYAFAQRQFYRGCLILGTVDFIFGDASAIFQNCILTLRRPLDNQQNIVLAQGRTDKQETTGFVIHNCRFVADADLEPDMAKFRSYIGRPWKEFSHTLVMESEISDLIQPEGYMPWEGNFALDTLSYKEFNNKGAGADTSKRVKWKGFKVIDKAEAMAYTPQEFIQADDWIPKTGTPIRMGLFGQ